MFGSATFKDNIKGVKVVYRCQFYIVVMCTVRDYIDIYKTKLKNDCMV